MEFREAARDVSAVSPQGRSEARDDAGREVRDARAKTSRFLRHVHYFRAFAIVCILFAHLWDLPVNSEHRSVLYSARQLLFHSSTMYFLFISGFLFIHLSANFDAARYYKTKLLYVLLPYTVFSTLVFFAKHPGAMSSGDLSWVGGLAKTLWGGTAVGPYWYVPFVAVLFLVSPLLLRIPPKQFRWLCILAGPLPLLGTRTGDMTLPQFAYFFPVYLLGCLAATDYPAFLKFVRTHRWSLVGALVLSSTAIAALHTRSCYVGWINITESSFYVQKISLCCLVLGALQRWEEHDIPLLGTIATYSFALYFTHPLIGCLAVRSLMYRAVPEVPALLWAASLVFVLLLLACDLALCVLARRVLGKWSRYVIGA